MTHGDNLKKMLLQDNQKKIKGLLPWAPATALNFVVLIASLKIDPKLEYCRFVSKNLKKIPIKKFDYSTLLVQYVSKPRSTLTQKISKTSKPTHPNGPRPTVRLGPLLVVRGGLAKMGGIYNFLQKFTKKSGHILSFFKKKVQIC